MYCADLEKCMKCNRTQAAMVFIILKIKEVGITKSSATKSLNNSAWKNELEVNQCFEQL